MKKEELFNIIIPTRERADTLIHALHTVVSQDYENLNIIVSDNFSQDNTKDIVASFADKRIKYINTGKRVSMSHNWEFALGHVKGGYVFFMGDDDGLLPNAIQTANQLLTEYVADALAWKKASYAWPNYINPTVQNDLVISLRRGIEIRNSKQMLERVCNFDSDLDGQSYEILPGLYNSFVSISAINKARSKTGRFFCSLSPDVYSAIAITSSVNNYIYSYSPLSIDGASGHSGGRSYMKDPKLAAAAKFLGEDNIPFHADLLLAPSIPVVVAESVWQVRDNVPNCEDYDVNIERLISEACRLSATLSEESRGLVDAALDRVREVRGAVNQTAIIGSSGMQPAIDGDSDSISRKIYKRWKRYESYIYVYRTKLPVNEVSNVYEASIFFKELEKRRWATIFNRTFKAFLMLVTVEMAVIGHKVLSKFSRGVRKPFRIARLAKVAFYQLGEMIRFAISLPPQPRVLIVEPNICHAEFTIGVANYLKQLGYNCQFLVSTEVGKENPFCRIPKGFSTVHYLKYSLIMKIITSRFLSLYDLAILSSSFDYRKMIPFTEIYRFRHKPKNGMLFIEHGFQNVVSANPILFQAYEAKRLLVLTNYQDDENLTEIGPCYFGDITTRDKKNSPVIVLVPGSNSQDVSSLILAAKTLVDKGLVGFELHIIGAPANDGARKFAESIGINNYVKLLGRVDFPTLYRAIEECDFLVGPQDISNYLNLKTSGSKLLSIGFLKPLIVPNELATAWGFDASNCIYYSADQGLVGAIERALLMQGEEYSQLVDSLRVARAKVEKDSLLRLRKLLSELALATTSAET